MANINKREQSDTKIIPRIIHYCWFGNAEKQELIKKCIASWRKYLSDYEIREWNNEDLAKCTIPFVLEAAETKNWAFVADYFRFYATYNFGGIYFDTDQEVVSNLDCFLDKDFFTGYENASGHILPFASMFGAKKGNIICKKMLEEYEQSKFNMGDKLNIKTVNQRFADLLARDYKISKPYNENKTIEFVNNSYIYPSNYFCKEGSKYVIHHFAASWVDNVRKFWELRLPFNFVVKFYICKEETKAENILPEKELQILKFYKSKIRYIVVTIGNIKD